jgi:glycosyltransferase involved in cell wall biosynthesis
MKKKRIAIVVNVIPHYRKDFYDRLFGNSHLKITVYCNPGIPNSSLKSIHLRYEKNIRILKSYFLLKESFVCTILPWWEIINDYDLVIIEANPRYFSYFLLATYMRLCKKNIALWTMVFSQNNNIFFQRLRFFWLSFYNKFLVYSEKDLVFLKKIAPDNSTIFSVNNGLDQHEIEENISFWNKNRINVWRKENGLKGRIILLSCARLELKNLFLEIINILPEIIKIYPNVILCIIGDGIELVNLTKRVKNLGLNNHVKFLGAIHQEEKLAPWFLSSRLLIHPGSIGLSLFHALGYGLPVITHSNWKAHAPEFLAFKDINKKFYFTENNFQEMQEVIIKQIKNINLNKRLIHQSRLFIKRKYNTSVMAERFIRFVNTVTNKKKYD